MKSFKILIAVSVLALSATSALAGGVGDNAQYGSWGDMSSTPSSNASGSNIVNESAHGRKTCPPDTFSHLSRKVRCISNIFSVSRVTFDEKLRQMK